MAKDDLLKIEFWIPTFTWPLDEGRSPTTNFKFSAGRIWSNMDQVIISGPIRNGQEAGGACLYKNDPRCPLLCVRGRFEKGRGWGNTPKASTTLSLPKWEIVATLAWSKAGTQYKSFEGASGWEKWVRHANLTWTPNKKTWKEILKGRRSITPLLFPLLPLLITASLS